MHTGKLPPRSLETAWIAIYDPKIRDTLAFETERRPKAALAAADNQHIKDALAASVVWDRPLSRGKGQIRQLAPDPFR